MIPRMTNAATRPRPTIVSASLLCGSPLKSLMAAGMSATAPTTPMKMNARFTSFLPAVWPAVVMSSRAPRPVNVCAWSRRGRAQLRAIAAETAIRSLVTLLMF